MRVNWKEPADNGGSPITGYIVEMRDSENKIWDEVASVTPYELSSLITKLVRGTRYLFRVSAVNKYGTSEPTEISEPVEAKYPFNVPNPPINVAAKDVTESSCLITFDPPTSDGGSPVTGYYIERKQTSTSRWLRVTREPISSLSYRSNDLVEGLEYEYRVIAENKAGPSEPSEPCKPFIAKNPFDKPGPPLNLKPGEVTKSSVELTWSPPLNDGGAPIIGYKIEKRNTKTLKWVPCETVGRITQCQGTVNDLKEGQEYEFRVIAQNAAGDGEPSAPTSPIIAKTKIIGDKPTLLEPMKDLRVLVGESAHFIAKIKAKPFPDIKWSLNDRNLSTRDDFVSTFDNNSLELTIGNVQPNHQGVYKVIVTNALGELSTDAKLTVLKKPTIKYEPKFEKIVDVIAGQNLNIRCAVDGLPKPDCTWFKDRVNVTLGGEISRAITEHGEQYANFNLNKIKRTEGGEYSIRAINEVGQAEAKFNVRVLDVPMPPDNLKAEDISSYSCKLKWTPPKDDGNCPVSGYFVEKLDPKRNAWVRVDKTSLCEIYVDKLQKGQSYQFRVIAENKIGLSEPFEMPEPIIAKSKFYFLSENKRTRSVK